VLKLVRSDIRNLQWKRDNVGTKRDARLLVQAPSSAVSIEGSVGGAKNSDFCIFIMSFDIENL